MRFTAAGMNEVRRWHDRAIQGDSGLDELGDMTGEEGLLELVGSAADGLVPEVAPGTRFDAAALLYAVLDPLVRSGRLRPASDDGFWTWLAAMWRVHLVKPDGTVGAVERWVSALKDPRRYYRHLLAAPYLLYAGHADRPERTRFLLANPLHTPGEMAGQVGATAGLASSVAALEAATLLFWDEERQMMRAGVRSKGGGSARRLSVVLNQFARTYSLPDLERDGLLGILPAEFEA